MHDIGTIDFMVYDGDGKTFFGVASTTLPNKNQKTITVSGAGIGGDVNVPSAGQYEAMQFTLTFRNYSSRVARLRKPGRHQIELRVAQQNEDPVTGKMEIVSIKHVMVVVPSNASGGNIAPASPSDTNVTFEVRYWMTMENGVVVDEIDQFNGINIIDGVDYGAPIRAALGL